MNGDWKKTEAGKGKESMSEVLLTSDIIHDWVLTMFDMDTQH